ncbi:TolC family protein [Pigmentiphaga humi]|nr:TolC family protein [Pigmentiphaga humi]
MPFIQLPFCRSRPRSAAWHALALLACLAGCAAPPAVPELATDVPAQWQNAAGAGIAPAAGPWWQAFGDPMLDQLIGQALAGNFGIAEAQARLQAARRLAGAAQAPYRPALAARTRDAIAADASTSYFQAGFDATWELGLFGRAESVQRQADASVAGAAASLQGARVSVAAEVARAYREMRNAQERTRLLEQAVAVQQRRGELLAVRQRARLAAGAELDQAGAALEQARAQLAEPAIAMRQAAQRLAMLLGRAAPDPAWLTPSAASAPDAPAYAALPAAPADMLRTRPDIQLAQARVLDAAGALGVAHADLYPRLGLGGSLTVAVSNIGRRASSASRTVFSFGPLIDIPLFDWGQRRAAEQARDDELEAALLAYRQAVLEGLSEAESALVELDEYRKRREAEQRALQALRKADGQGRELVRLRLASEYDSIDLAARRVQAELALSATTLAQELAFISLHKAVGGAPAWTAAGATQATSSSAGPAQTRDGSDTAADRLPASAAPRS